MQDIELIKRELEREEQFRKEDEYQDFMKECGNNFMNMFNNFSYEKQEELLYQMISREHRTLQQNFWRALFGVIKRYSNNNFDDRNKNSVENCKKLVPLVNESYFSTI